jgi:hypothetical protein
MERRERFERLSPEEKASVREKLRELRDHGTIEEKRQFRERLREKLLQQEKE